MITFFFHLLEEGKMQLKGTGAIFLMTCLKKMEILVHLGSILKILGCLT